MDIMTHHSFCVPFFVGGVPEAETATSEKSVAEQMRLVTGRRDDPESTLNFQLRCAFMVHVCMSI